MLALGATAALVGAGVLCTAAPASAAETISTTYSYTGATETWTVPAGVSSISYVVTGGSGGAASGPDGGAGGLGGSVSGTIAVTAGQTIEFTVGGQGGAGGDNDAPGAGGWGYSSGGAGGPGSITTLGLAGAGGGGATAVVIDGTVVAVAGGGGGGGGRGKEAVIIDLGAFGGIVTLMDACPGGAGGAADAAGSSAPGDSSDLCLYNGSGGAIGSTAGVGGVGGTGYVTAAQGGGGGGGGGYSTGGGGGGTRTVAIAASGGGGGAGGTSYDSTGAATIGAAASLGNGSISISYDLSYDTATSLAVSPNPAVIGQSVTYSATVTNSTDASIVPVGTVTFTSGATTIGTAALDSSGTAEVTTDILDVGSHPVSATFAPGASTAFEASSDTTTVVINKGDTITDLLPIPAAPTFGDTVSLQATVSVASPAVAVPTGTVAFAVDGFSIGIASLDASGVATLSWTPTTAGAHQLSADYSGDPDLNPSSTLVDLGVLQAATTTSVTIPVPSSILGIPLDLHAFVASAAGSPTGFVQFNANGSPVGAPVAVQPDGTAALTTAALPLGSVAVTAQYLGDTDFAGSLSDVVPHRIDPPTAALAQTGSGQGIDAPLGALVLLILGVGAVDYSRQRRAANAAK
jgi:hypothetical protein